MDKDYTGSPTTGTKAQRKVLSALHERFHDALEADERQRRDAMEDIKFAVVPGYQWEENQKKERGARPCYEFNKIRVTGKRIINNMRDNRPSGKVRGTEDTDKDTAEIYEGLIRNIWAKNGDAAMDYAAEYQVFAGYGAWRIDIEEMDDDPFNPDIGIETIYNPFNCFADPSSRDTLKRDARYWILTSKMPNTEYEEKYPKAEVVPFESHEFDDEVDWKDDEETRIAEYWYKEPVDKEMWQLQDGRVVDAESDGADIIPEEAIKAKKVVKTHKIMMCISSGNAILEGPTEWAGTLFPFVPVYGEYYIVDGKTHWNGITRFATDAQRSYNVARTAVTETIAMAPQAKYWATSTQAEGHVKDWKIAHQKNYPFMLYTPDPVVPGPPVHKPAAEIPMALIQESQLAAEEINMVTGIYQGDIGAPNQATSGRQEIARQQAGAIATFNYTDNMAKSIERTWEILIDLIPKVYTTARSLRVLGQDGAEDYVKIYDVAPHPQTGELVTVHDLSVGKYDVTVTVGPNFTTRRQEAAETYQGLLQGQPELMPIIGDLVFKSMDLPYAEDIADRMKIMLPPQIQQSMNEDQQVPPEVMQMMQQAQMAMQQVEQQMAMVQEAAQQAGMDKAEVEKLTANLKTEQANLETDVAKFDAHIAKQMAGLAQKEAKITVQAVGASVDKMAESTVNEAIEVLKDDMAADIAEVNEAMAIDASQGMDAIAQATAAISAKVAEVLSQIETAKAEKPRIAKVVSSRENGQLVATPIYEVECFDDEPTQH